MTQRWMLNCILTSLPTIKMSIIITNTMRYPRATAYATLGDYEYLEKPTHCKIASSKSSALWKVDSTPEKKTQWLVYYRCNAGERNMLFYLVFWSQFPTAVNIWVDIKLKQMVLVWSHNSFNELHTTDVL